MIGYRWWSLISAATFPGEFLVQCTSHTDFHNPLRRKRIDKCKDYFQKVKVIWLCFHQFENVGFLRSGENRSTLYLKRNPSRARREPITNSTRIWRHRQDLCPGYTGESTAPPLLPIIENKWLSLLNHRSHSTPQRRLRRPATVPKPITFCKVTNKHQTFFFFFFQ